ncbi:proprotein convertase P-domain-containing protein [Marinobacterium rhizophilum]|uniref:proprotein convertase P-domain-containing protein n=1 Tax=Marinobacterium rhizophilum TaxID=420402 RepID=UPI00037EF50D|nr:proprotein convertase P-domain-containing protein [Marinobacterium rhizophilum]
MSEINKQEDLGLYLWRAGERVSLVKDPDRFTVRLKRGITREKVGTNYNAAYCRRLRRQNLDEYSVQAEERDAIMERVRRGSEVEFASHVYAPVDEPQAKVYPMDEITVQFRLDASDSDIEAIMAEFGLTLEREIRDAPRVYVFRVGPQATENPIKIANRLAQNDKVIISEPNVAIASQSCYTPSDTLFPNQWHLFNSGGPLLSTAGHIDTVHAWDLSRGERSVVVAVADDSCDLHHSDFQAADKVVSPRDFAGHDFEPLPELEDDNHGTACCGVAVAEENGIGVVGVAPGCALMPIRTSGMIDDSSIEDLCDWVIDHGASVMSCSWGVAARSFSLSLRMNTALHRAATVGRGGRGCVLVFASGNDNRPVNGIVDESGWPNNQPNGPTRWLAGFAAHEDVIAVAASSSLATKSAYSNWGREITVCAPSNNVPPRTYPRVTVPVSGRGIVTTDRVGPSGYSSTDYTAGFGGTSSACPTVAGAAALILSANPNLTAGEVREIMQSTADKIIDNNPDPQLGNLFGTYDGNGHSQWFGYGRVNAFQAVTEARRRLQGATGQIVSEASSPELAIPDHSAVGARDTIHIDASGSLASIKVSLDLTHTYIGDLRLTLIAPSGREVVLHDRNGGSSDNIQRSYDVTTTPGLSVLAGEPIEGDWVLWVQDLAAVDLGTLNQWELEITTQASTVVEVEEFPGVSIPDNDPAGIERSLNVAEDGQVQDVEVSVDITHTYIGDLVISLVSPAGTTVPLHVRTGRWTDNIITTYTTANLPALQVLHGETVQGEWRLKVADMAGADKGKLNRWGLRLTRKP